MMEKELECKERFIATWDFKNCRTAAQNSIYFVWRFCFFILRKLRSMKYFLTYKSYRCKIYKKKRMNKVRRIL